MKKQICCISIHQSSKVIAILYFVFSLLVMIPLGIYTCFTGEMIDALIFFALPFVYLIFSYIGFVVFFWFYNLIAKSFGGVEFTLSDSEKME